MRRSGSKRGERGRSGCANTSCCVLGRHETPPQLRPLRPRSKAAEERERAVQERQQAGAGASSIGLAADCGQQAA